MVQGINEHIVSTDCTPNNGALLYHKKQYYMNNKDLCKHIKHQVSICLSKLIVLQTLMKENRCEGEKIPPKTKTNIKQFMYNVNNRVQCSCVPHTINVSLLYEHGHG